MSDTNTSGSAPVKKNITRRDVLAMAGCGVAGLVVGGALASWGVTQESIASGRIELRTTPTKMIVTDRARCSGCQRCEMMCTLKNDGRVCQHIARVRVWDNYYWGKSADTVSSPVCSLTAILSNPSNPALTAFLLYAGIELIPKLGASAILLYLGAN